MRRLLTDHQCDLLPLTLLFESDLLSLTQGLLRPTLALGLDQRSWPAVLLVLQPAREARGWLLRAPARASRCSWLPLALAAEGPARRSRSFEDLEVMLEGRRTHDYPVARRRRLSNTA